MKKKEKLFLKGEIDISKLDSDVQKKYEIAKELGTQVLGKMPIDPEFARMADGSFAQAVNPYIDDAVMALRRLK